MLKYVSIQVEIPDTINVKIPVTTHTTTHTTHAKRNPDSLPSE